MKKERGFQFDFLRAFAIITVVASHIFTMFEKTPGETEIKEYINTIGRFSVPIFFFLSGLFFRTNGDFKYLKDKVIKVLIPYSIVSIPATIFLIWKYKWSFANLPEIIFSYLFGYKFGYFFIFLIISTYIIGFCLAKFNTRKNTNAILIISFVLQLAWLAVDELVYKKFNLYDKYFYQFQINELIINHPAARPTGYVVESGMGIS